MELINHLEKLKKNCKQSLIVSLSLFAFIIIWVIIFVVVRQELMFSLDLNLITAWDTGLTVVLGLGLSSLMVASLIFNILVCVNAITAESKNKNGKTYSELNTIKVLGIVSIFLFGLIVSIVLYFVVKNLINDVKKDINSIENLNKIEAKNNDNL